MRIPIGNFLCLLWIAAIILLVLEYKRTKNCIQAAISSVLILMIVLMIGFAVSGVFSLF